MIKLTLKIQLLSFCLCITSPLMSQIDHWETAVYSEYVWRYFLGQEEPPENWTVIEFQDNSWLEGQGGIGYGDDDDNTVINPVSSVYMRHEFQISNVNNIERIVLHADYDDGFVAYLNGTEIARSTNLTGNPPAYDSWTTDFHEAGLYLGIIPESYVINALLTQSLILPGTNVLSIQTHNYQGTNSSDLSSNYWLSFGIGSTNYDYGQPPIWFADYLFESPLPMITINTFGANIPDEPSIPGEMGIIWNGVGNLNSIFDFPSEYFGNISIERRGQSSLDFPKSNYAIELKDAAGNDMDSSFLDFPKEEDWILHGPYSDKTLLRNVLAMHLAEGMNQYSSRTRLVELIVNSQYAGIYILMEKIKQDDNRVDIANLKMEDLEGDDLTGGYVFKIDKGAADWFSQYNMFANNQKLSFQYVSPNRSNIMPAQEQYIKRYVDSMENAILNPTIGYGGKKYDEYLDINSFVDHFLINELARDVDAYRISSYLYKDKNSKGGLVHAGPIWDYNLAFGNAYYCQGESTSGWIYEVHCGNGNPFWWKTFMEDPLFRNKAKCRWQELRNDPWSNESILAFIDDKTLEITASVDRNFERWPILDQDIWPNVVVTGSYTGEINYMKGYIEDRLVWMDANMIGECIDVGNTDENSIPLAIYPNPVRDLLYLDMKEELKSKAIAIIYNSIGQEVLRSDLEQKVGQIVLDVQSLASGQVYFLQISSAAKKYEVLRFVKM